jgi:hypothetical protein
LSFGLYLASNNARRVPKMYNWVAAIHMSLSK